MRLLILLLATCSMLHADVLVDLKTTLAGLSGGEPVKARVACSFSNRSGDEDKPVVEEANITVQIADGPEGLTILWPRELIDTAAAEIRAKGADPDRKRPTCNAMGRLSAMALNDYLNCTPMLQQLLDQSELVSDKPETSEGRSTRLLTLKVSQKLPKYVKALDCTVRLRLDADGIPVSAERQIQVRGRAYLVIGFESVVSESWQFARVGPRLFVTRHARESQSSGGGEKGLQKTVASLAVVDR